MKLREIMSQPVIRIHSEETVSVAARMLLHYNIGAVPVCGADGRLCGLLTDRDIVTRCLASGRTPASTKVGEIMTGNIITAKADMDTDQAAALMAKKQIRRLPVVENGRLCGMVSLGDLATKEESTADAAEALTGISSHLSRRD